MMVILDDADDEGCARERALKIGLNPKITVCYVNKNQKEGKANDDKIL